MTYAADGDVLTGNDSVNGNWTYTYDDFNRALTAVSNTGEGCSWDYDRYGNRWHQNTHSGTCLAPQYSFTGNNNRIDGASYDAAGNLLSDGVHNYLYDAENRIKSIDSGATTYTYDAEDRRVAKTTGGLTTDFIYDREGHIILTNPATPTLMEMYAAGLHLGTYEENTQHTDTIFYYDHGDWLGTERARVDLTGTVCETITSLPFGDNQVMSGSCVDVSPMHFTGKMRDTESNLDYFDARFYSSGLGRFLTADWAVKPTAVPYAMFGNPQSLNLYSYVENNPVIGIDPDGHAGEPSDYIGDASGFYDCKVSGTCTGKDGKAQNTKKSWWASLTGTLAVGVARISPSAARKLWEAANPGQKVPLDAVRGRFYDMAHVKALADGGTNAAENLKPQEHGEHMAEHMANGDFARWAGRAKDTVVDAAQSAGREIESDARQSANEIVNDVREAATEVMENPGEAVRDAATAVGEAIESGEIPPP